MEVDEATLSKHWLQRATKSISAARSLANNGWFNAAHNRIFYACFYALTAALIKTGKRPKTHAGVKLMLNRDFVKTGKVPKKLEKFYLALSDKLYEDDFKGPVKFTAEEIEALINEAAIFIAAIEKLISENP